MALPCIEVKRFEISMSSCTWLLQQPAAIMAVGKGGHGGPRPLLNFEMISKKGYFFNFEG